MGKTANIRRKINRNGFIIDVFINKTKRIVVAKLVKFPDTHANISMGSLRIDDTEKAQEINKSKQGLLKNTNVVKICEIPMFNQLPKIVHSAKCHPNDEWKTGVGVQVACDRVYKHAFKVLRNSILNTIGTADNTR